MSKDTSNYYSGFHDFQCTWSQWWGILLMSSITLLCHHLLPCLTNTAQILKSYWKNCINVHCHKSYNVALLVSLLNNFTIKKWLLSNCLTYILNYMLQWQQYYWGKTTLLLKINSIVCYPLFINHGQSKYSYLWTPDCNIIVVLISKLHSHTKWIIYIICIHHAFSAFMLLVG